MGHLASAWMWIEKIVQIIAGYEYLVLALLAFIEGPVSMIAAGIMVHNTPEKFVYIILAFMAGDLFGDYLWYVIGRYGADSLIKKVLRFFGTEHDLYEHAKHEFRRHDIAILFISKITIGLGVGIGVMVAAGAAHVRIWRFAAITTIGSSIMVLCLMLIGYLFGDAISAMPKDVKILAIVITLVGVVIALKYIMAYLKRTLHIHQQKSAIIE